MRSRTASGTFAFALAAFFSARRGRASAGYIHPNRYRYLRLLGRRGASLKRSDRHGLCLGVRRTGQCLYRRQLEQPCSKDHSGGCDQHDCGNRRERIDGRRRTGHLGQARLSPRGVAVDAWATSTFPIPEIPGFARSRPAGPSRRLPEQTRLASGVTGVRQRPPSSASRAGLRWIRSATSTWPTR